MFNVDQIIAQIRAFARERGLRPATLAQQAGLSPNALRDFDSSDWNPRTATLRKLSAYVQSEVGSSQRGNQ